MPPRTQDGSRSNRNGAAQGTLAARFLFCTIADPPLRSTSSCSAPLSRILSTAFMRRRHIEHRSDAMSWRAANCTAAVDSNRALSRRHPCFVACDAVPRQSWFNIGAPVRTQFSLSI